MIRSRYDAIVVGSRVAGAATGMLLAREGLDVLIVDGARYGSDTLSTLALMRGGVQQLARWGLLREVVGAGTPPVRRTTFRYGESEEVVEIRPKPGYDGLYAPRRTVLDPILADAAFRAGADVRFGTRVTDLIRADGGRVAAVTVTDRAGRTTEARAPIVIGADGGRSLVARAAGARTVVRARSSSEMAVSFYSGVEADGYQWLYGLAPDGTGLSAGVIPTNAGEVCVWAGAPSTMFATRRPEQLLDDVMRAIAPDWAARLRAGERHGPVRGFPGLHGYVRRAWGDGWALVGDAGYFKDPITAHGITDALRDAELLARAVLAGAADPSVTALALADYEQTRDRLSLKLFRITDEIASYRWSMDELRELLLALSAAMRAEVDHLGSFDTPDPEPAVA